MGIRKVAIPFKRLCSAPSEGGRGRWWTGQQVSLEEGLLALTLPQGWVPESQRDGWTAQSNFWLTALEYHVASKLCLIFQTILFCSWLPLSCFIDCFSHCPYAELTAGFVSFLYFSTCVCDSLGTCCVVSQSPVVHWQLLSVPSDYHWWAAYFPFQVINE